jgi:hypothetical protein
LLALTPDVIVASGSLAVAAFQRLTRTVPIVFTLISDPIGAGFVDSLARPGGNTTGFMVFEYSVGGKWLELLKEIAPSITRVAALVLEPLEAAYPCRSSHGNEIGMGAVAQAVHEHVPHGKILCAELATDVLIPAGVSNWGCYAIQAALAILLAKPDFIHTAAMERRLVDAAANAGLVDGNTGKCEPTVDGMPIEVHAGIVELIGAAARQGLKPRH